MEYPNKNTILPSKAFLIRGGIATGIITIILLVQTTWFKGLFSKNPKTEANIGNATVQDLVGKDTNGNGIPDWEEQLWGLDPTVIYTNGVPNKQIIEEKKKALGITDENSENENETDILAKQLFTITNALDQNSVTPESLKKIGAELGNGVDLKQVSNKYSISNIVSVKTTDSSLRVYYKVMSDIVSKYKSTEADLEIIVETLESGDSSRLPELAKTEQTYKLLAGQLQKVSVPLGIAQQHLNLINGIYGMSDSFKYLQQLEENGVYGLVGIGTYKEYALKTEQALSELRDYLQQYGII